MEMEEQKIISDYRLHDATYDRYDDDDLVVNHDLADDWDDDLADDWNDDREWEEFYDGPNCWHDDDWDDDGDDWDDDDWDDDDWDDGY